MTPRGSGAFTGYSATALVVAGSFVAGPPLPLAVAGAVGASVLLARSCLGPDRAERPAPRHPVDALLHEVERSRRYGRPCSLARVLGGAEASVAETRRTDEAWDIGGDLMLLMPETTSIGAHLAVARLVGDRAAGMAIATFPEDALTVHGLLEAMRVEVPAADAAPDQVSADIDTIDLGVEVG